MRLLPCHGRAPQPGPGPRPLALEKFAPTFAPWVGVCAPLPKHAPKVVQSRIGRSLVPIWKRGVVYMSEAPVVML